MNRKMWVWVAVAVIVLLGLVWFSFRTKPSENGGLYNSTTTSDSTVTNQPQKSAVYSDTDTYVSVFNQSGSHVCTYDQVTQTSRSSNTIYIADGKMRGEFRTTTGGVNSNNNIMVYNKGILYTWKEGMDNGTKIQIKTLADLPVSIPRDLTTNVVSGSGLNTSSWDCHNWRQDNSMLVPPTGVKFN